MEKMQEMFTKDLGKTKEQTNRDEQCTKRNQQQNNWGRRMDEWPGRQNGGNHYCRTEYRKTMKKKWRQPKS